MRTTTSLLVSSLLALTLATGGCASEPAGDDAQALDQDVRGATNITALLAKVPAGTPWNKLPWSTRYALERNAELYFKQVRHDWGTRGLDEKEARLVHAPTPAMIDNYDRLVRFLMSADTPEGFKASTDVKNAELGLALKRLYLVYIAERRQVTVSATTPEMRDWDGGEIRELLVPDATALEQQKAYAADIEKQLRALPQAQLTDVEKAIVSKAYFIVRQLKHGSTGFNLGGDDTQRPGPAAGWLYDVVTEYAPNGRVATYVDDEAFLQALNAFTFQRLLQVNVGTVDAFDWNHEQFTDPGWMKDSGLDPAAKVAGKNYLTLAGWWKERVHALPSANNRCTVWSKTERNDLWDALTADNLTNADGGMTLDAYAKSYAGTITRRLDFMKATAAGAVDGAFPVGSPLLTEAQRAVVKQAIQRETKPAAIVETLTAALDQATGKTDASTKLKAELDGLTMIGGYAEGEALRPADDATVKAMWNDVKAYIAQRYAGKPIDLGALVPAAPIITTSDGIFAGSDGNVTVGLQNATNRASLYKTLLHEIKHVIDYRSHASVQGAAWEGAAVLTEDLVGMPMLSVVMANEAAKLPMYSLQVAIDEVRLTATTDATLKVLLRSSCTAKEPDSIAFAKGIVASYGYTNPDTLTLRSRRAHNGAQYLSYDLGSVVYADLMTWLGQQAGASVDPMLLQACGMPSPNKDAAAVTKLKTCLGK